MRALNTFLSTKSRLAAALLAFGALAVLTPTVNAQIAIGIGIQPVCSYGYYDYAPYSCAPVGFYGSGYFYNGIFLGMGPWAGWGYGHGWGAHRFVNDGGGRYHGAGGRDAYRVYTSHNTTVHTNNTVTVHNKESVSHTEGSRPSAAHVASPHASPSHSEAPHGGGAPHASAAPHSSAAHEAPHGGGGEHK